MGIVAHFYKRICPTIDVFLRVIRLFLNNETFRFEDTFKLYSIELKITFIITHKRNNVVVLFGTLKVQSFMFTEVRDCDLLIVVTSSTFLKRKDILKEKRYLAQIIKTRSPHIGLEIFDMGSGMISKYLLNSWNDKVDTNCKVYYGNYLCFHNLECW